MITRRAILAAGAMSLIDSEVEALSAGRRAILSGSSSLFFNINATTTSNFKAAYIAQAANIPVAFMGDSTVRGVDETAAPYNAQYPNATPMKLAALFNAAGINAGANNWYGLSGTSFNDYIIRDSRVAASGLATTGSQQCQGGANVFFNAGASTFSFTPQFNTTKADIYWRDGGAGNTFSWQVDGGAATNLTTTGTAQFVKTTISLGTAAIHTILLTQVLGSPQIYGIDCYDDMAGRKEITLRQWGTSGATSGIVISNAGTPGAGRLQQLTNYPTKLVISECGLVNDWRLSTAVATSKANMLTLINAVKAVGSDFWFLTPPYDGSALGLAASQNDYVQAMYDLAVSENVGLIDIRKLWVSAANQVALGLTGDSVHPTIVLGYPSEAQVIYNAMRRII